jgi:hypothetical protein
MGASSPFTAGEAPTGVNGRTAITILTLSGTGELRSPVGTRRLPRRIAIIVKIAMAASVIVGVSCSTAHAATAPWWHLTSSARPTNLPPGGEGTIVVQAVNVGDAATSGAVTLTDRLPAGVTAQSVAFFAFPPPFERGKTDLSAFLCEPPTPGRVECTYASFLPNIEPYEHVELAIKVKIAAGAEAGSDNQAEVTGGGAPSVSITRPLMVQAAAPIFGVEGEGYELTPEEEGGTVDARAGSHPFQLTATLVLNAGAETGPPEFREASEPALPKDLQFHLPPGLVGNAQALPQCSIADFQRIRPGGLVDFCPADTAIGVASVTVDEANNLGLVTLPVPLFNLTPAVGEPARFGFEPVKVPVTLDTSVRSGGDYGVTVSVRHISQLAVFLSSQVTFWGVPGDPRHDHSRGWGCLAGGSFIEGSGETCLLLNQSRPAPFLTLPTSCAGPFETSVEGDSWPTKADPVGISTSREYSLQDNLGRRLGLIGCNDLPFDPSIEVAPDVQSASTPTGLKVDVRVPQEVSENPSGLSSSSVKNIAVTFPRGVAVNPAAADSLEACSESLVGFTGFREFEPESEPGSKTALFTPTLASPFCPTASKIGTVRIKVPIIARPLEGALYLAAQDANPFQTLVAMYIVAEDKQSGVLVKLPGKVTLDEQTGQLTSTFENSPQAPLEDAEIHLFGGSRAPLSTPPRCGSYTTNASFTPWSGSASAASNSTFAITSGPAGGPCPTAALPFTPTLTAGTTNINAGAFTPLTTTIGREDGNQDVRAVQLHMPPGLSGILSGVQLCPEAQANAGTCGPESLIGHTIVSVGLGNEPFTVTGGEVFLTEKYEGAPFGLSIVNPAVAGPFNLGKVVVRAKIDVDPHSAELTVTTGAIPHILDGIPLQIKHVNVTITRPGFTFNPTNCNPMSISGQVNGAEGASAPMSVPFQVTNCAVLKFTPKFSVSTSGKTSKVKGASLTARVTEPAGALGTQANITKVKVELPIQLPSRLTTLQKACLDKVFNANPAACPPQSIIGHAKVITPLLPVPLTGPAYFVSHGGEAFPSLTIVLQGYGVTVELVGTTFIDKKGITSTTFKTVPDTPFNTFELTLPQGKFSALGANLPAKAKSSFCGQHLKMPTEFTAQNGLQIHQNTNIAVTGCPKAKTRAQLYAAALKACKKKSRAKRSACQRAARKKYGPVKRKE